jgi:hypothetical protein
VSAVLSRRAWRGSGRESDLRPSQESQRSSRADSSSRRTYEGVQRSEGWWVARRQPLLQPRPMVGRLSTFGRAVDSASPIATFDRQTNLDCLPPGSLSHRVSSSLADCKEILTVKCGAGTVVLYCILPYPTVKCTCVLQELEALEYRSDTLPRLMRASRVKWMRTHEGGSLVSLAHNQATRETTLQSIQNDTLFLRFSIEECSFRTS